MTRNRLEKFECSNLFEAELNVSVSLVEQEKSTH